MPAQLFAANVVRQRMVGQIESYAERQRRKNRQGLLIIAAVIIGLGVVFAALYLLHGGHPAGLKR